MADTVFSGVGVAGSDLKAVDNGDGTYLVSIEAVSGADATKDLVFDTWPPLRAVYLDVGGDGLRRYGIEGVLQ